MTATATLPKVSRGYRVESERLRTVLKVASTDVSRPMLSAVAVYERDGVLSFAATDSYRLLVDGELDAGQRPDFLVNRADLVELLKGLGKRGQVNLAVTSDGELWGEGLKSGKLASEPRRLTLVDAAFPNVTALLPDTAGDTSIVVGNAANTAAFLRRLARVAGNACPLVIRADGSAACSTDIGAWAAPAGTFDVEGELPDGMALDPGFLADALEAPAPTVAGGVVVLQVRSSLKPVMIEQGGVRVLLMPMRTN